MDVLKFALSGKTAFFKKPDVNTYYYFTYGTIHKIALLGILGAICGYKGYNQQHEDKNQVYPEFYEKLQDIQVGVVTKNEQGYIPKKMQLFNNSVGYASKEQGGNLIVKEQWLENPLWDIYVLIKSDTEEEVVDRILNRKYQFIPFLGKNDHIANITDIQLLKDVKKPDEFDHIDSLFLKKDFILLGQEDDLEDIDREYVPIYKYEEMLPRFLEKETNQYILETFVGTNCNVEQVKDCQVFTCGNNLIYFF